jgi:hypothetical protein
VYQDLTTGTDTLSQKIEDVLTADSNGLISTDFSGIDLNAYLTPVWVNDGATALDVIQAVVALGDIDDDRWLFAIDNDRKARYYEMPDTIEYELALSDPAQRITTPGGGTWVKPWNVRPAKWITLTDFMATRAPATLREDPRATFIETVKFRAPWDVEVNGMKVSNLAQFLAKQGLGGSSS